MSDFLSDLGDGLAAVAPTIASAFGGPLAGLGVTWLEKALGVAPGTSEIDNNVFKKALQAAVADPVQVLALKTADLEFRQFCLDNDLRLEAVAAADRDSARQRQVAMGDTFPNTLAAAIFLAFIAVILAQFALVVMSAMWKFTLMPEAYRLIDSATGALSSLAGLVTMFYFGSNRQSKAKDTTISDMAATAANGNGSNGKK